MARRGATPRGHSGRSGRPAEEGDRPLLESIGKGERDWVIARANAYADGPPDQIPYLKMYIFRAVVRSKVRIEERSGSIFEAGTLNEIGGMSQGGVILKERNEPLRAALQSASSVKKAKAAKAPTPAARKAPAKKAPAKKKK
jgi:hypothetical protein